MQTITADYIFTPEKWLENHVMEITENGEIISLRPIQPKDKPIKLTGVLVPGFVNAHCHLELSALKAKIPRGTGMSGFVGNIVFLNNTLPIQVRENAVISSIQEGYDSGTQVFGDICNETLSLIPKTEFPQVYFHNFIEVYGSFPERAEEIMKEATTILKDFQMAYLNGNSSITLHAPYSASEKLIALYREFYQANQGLLSVHLLESTEERELFEFGTGGIAEFMRKVGIPFAGFPTRSPLEYLLPGLEAVPSGIFVHLTEATSEELAAIDRLFPEWFFCLCPRSNRYIHEKLPDISRFLPYSHKICLGTDSLASNDNLNMLEELMEIHLVSSEIPLHTLFCWLTVNGAKALKCTHCGDFTKEKTSGIIHIPNISIPKNILINTKSYRIAP